MKTPDDNWTPEQLGKYVADLSRKTAESIWLMGTALNIAHAKCKGGWEKWCGEYVPHLSKTTIWRFRRVAQLPFEEIKGAKLQDVYKRLQNGTPTPDGGLTDDPAGDDRGTEADRGLPPAAPVFEVAPADEPAPIGADGGADDEDDRGDLSDLEAKVHEVVEEWPTTVRLVEEAVVALSDALDIPGIDVEEAIRLLVTAMTQRQPA